MMSLINSNEKANYINEKNLCVQESIAKMKEKSKDKLSQHADNFLRNVFTTDGENPLSEVPPMIRELMSTAIDTTAENLNLILKKGKLQQSLSSAS